MSRILSIIAVIALLSALPATAAPGEPFLFMDLDPRRQAEGSHPVFFPQAVGGGVLFIAGEPAFGRELWRSDGTRRGTYLLADLCPGPCDPQVDRELLAPRSDLAFLVTAELAGPGQGIGARRLWRSDGTAAGTRPVAESGDRDSMRELTWLPAAGRLLFVNTTPDTGSELFVSDGTGAGTGLLRDLRPGPQGSGPAGLHRAGDVVYFASDDGSHGRELWLTDGTPEGTHLVADVVPGLAGSEPSVLGAVGDGLLLSVDVPGDGRVLWRTDGTAAGTRFVADPHPQGSGQYLASVSDGGRVYFFTEDDAAAEDGPYHLWTSDGTAAGTRRLTPEPDPLTLDRLSRDLVVVDDGRVVFDWRTEAAGREPWVSDGTVAGTEPLGDLCPGACSSRPLADHTLDFHEGPALLYFSADDGVHGVEPWVTDGTPGGTRMLTDACPGHCAGFVEIPLMANAAGRVLLTIGPSHDADLVLAEGAGVPAQTLVHGVRQRGVDARPLPGGERFLLSLDDLEHGEEPWVTDLTPEGTALARDLHPGSSPGSRPSVLATVADRLLFSTFPQDSRSDPAVWTSDGSRSGTQPVEGTPSFLVAALRSFEPLAAGVIGKRLLLLAPESRNPGAALRGVVLDVESGAWTQLPPLAGLTREHTRILPAGDRLFLVGSRVWVSDGTAAGTREIDAVGERLQPDAPAVVVDGRLYFDALHPVDQRGSLWRSDGTPGGTVVVEGLTGPGEGVLEAIAGLADSVVFAWGGRVLRSDGSPDGTTLLLQLPDEDGSVRGMATVGDRVLFGTERRLWATDGTVAGTTALDTPEVSWVVSLGERALFSAGSFGQRVLWSSDGTAEGTAPLDAADGSLHAGREWFFFEVLEPGDGWALLVGDRVDGRELFLSDGSSAGTVRLSSGPAGPRGAATLGDTLFYDHRHPRAGHELWAVHLDGAPPSSDREDCEPDGKTLCLLDGRFQVRAEWRDPRSGRSGQAGARPFPGSDRTGTFWFFRPDNVELIVKQLDGRSVNGFFWTFYGALTDVEYWIEVTDLEWGVSRTFHNPPREICGRGETAAFPEVDPASLSAPATAAADTADTPSCDTPGVLCLQDGRFRVSVDWRDQRSGATGAGTAIPGTQRSGYFWFFRPDNVELVVKVLDGRPVNGRFWVFYGALTDVEYDIRVVDAVSGEERTYHNPPGEICGDADTTAF